MSIKKARKTLQNKEKFNYDILDKVANSGGEAILLCIFYSNDRGKKCRGGNAGTEE